MHKQKHEQGMQSSATPAPSEAEQSNCKEEPQEEQPEEDDAAIKEKMVRQKANPIEGYCSKLPK